MALDEMNPGYGRQLFQIIHGETQGTVHHAVDGEAMCVRIELGKLGGVLLHEVERRRRDDSRIILKRGVVRHVIDAVSGPAARWLAVDVLRGGHGDPEAAEDVDLSRPSDWLSVALVSAVFLLHAVLLGPLGWPIAGALLFWGVAASLGSRSWLRDGAVSVLLAVAVYLIFTRALGVYLPGGLLDGVL